MGKKPVRDPIQEQLDRELQSHLKSLSMANSAEYKSWCKTHSFSSELYKTVSARKKELDLYKELQIKKAVAKGKEKHRPVARKIEDLLKSDDLTQVEDPFLKEILNNLTNIKTEEKKEFLTFIAYLDKESKLLTDSAINKAVMNVFKYKDKWIRSFSSWSPASKNINRQFSSLIKHLFTKYDLPEFLDSVWFQEGNVLYNQQVDWYLWLAAGNNIRKASKLPFILTKQMAHEFSNAPNTYNVFQAIRYGQIMGQEGDRRLVDAINETKLGRQFMNEEFWGQVILMFVQNPMLDRNQVGPIIDYLDFQKFSLNAPQRGLSMKGRNVKTLMEQVENWHTTLRKTQGRNFKEWASCGTEGFTKEESTGQFSPPKIWEVVELKNSKELDQEGKTQRHCVSSYAGSCVAKRCAIYSIRVDGERMATIEVIPGSKSIVQARGKFNAYVGGRALQIMREWSSNSGLSINCTVSNN